MRLLSVLELCLLLNMCAIVQCAGSDTESSGTNLTERTSRGLYLLGRAATTHHELNLPGDEPIVVHLCDTNEKWYDCLPQCPITCENVANSSCLLPRSPCRGGCECGSGYARPEPKHKCQPVDLCPGDEGEVRFLNGFASVGLKHKLFNTGQDKNPKVQVAEIVNLKKIIKNKDNDFDLEFYIEDSYGSDEKHHRRQKKRCGPNEIAIDVGNCQGDRKTCKKQCVCRPGTIPLNSECTPKLRCDPNEKLEVVCRECPKGDRHCHENACFQRCVCKPPLKHNGRECVPPGHCPEGWISLNNRCERKRMCSEHERWDIDCREDHCFQTCLCEENFIRVDDKCELRCRFPKIHTKVCHGNKCTFECRDPNCPTDERPWRPDLNENQCVDGHIKSSPVGGKDRRACLCKPSFVRDSQGRCVPEATCKAPQCPYPNTYIDGRCMSPRCSLFEEPWSPGACENVCRDGSLQCPDVTQSQNLQCVCKPEYMRDDSGNCVEKECPAKCSNSKMPWSSGACEWNCVDGELVCVEVPESKRRDCVCKPDLMNDGSDNCVEKVCEPKCSDPLLMLWTTGITEYVCSPGGLNIVEVQASDARDCVCKFDYMNDGSDNCVPKMCQPLCRAPAILWTEGIHEYICVAGQLKLVEVPESLGRTCVCPPGYVNEMGNCLQKECS